MEKKKEILIDKGLYEQLEDLVLSMPTTSTVDKLAEVFIFTGISQLAMFEQLLEGKDLIAELMREEAS